MSVHMPWYVVRLNWLRERAVKSRIRLPPFIFDIFLCIAHKYLWSVGEARAQIVGLCYDRVPDLLCRD